MPEATVQKDIGRDLRDSSHLVFRIEQLRNILRVRDPNSIATKSGTSYHEIYSNQGEFRIPYFDREYKLSWPEMIGFQANEEIISPFLLALFLFYLSTSDGTRLAGRWVTFADLPGGRIYASAFYGYTGMEISKKFGLDLYSFNLICTEAGGQNSNEGDSSFLFKVFPQINILAVYWRGDDEFPSTCNLLFDANAFHYLPIDACAIAGSLVARRLIGHAR